MKTEISVPNPIFEAAERVAAALRMSLGEFYVAALTAYVATFRNGDKAPPEFQVSCTSTINKKRDLYHAEHLRDKKSFQRR